MFKKTVIVMLLVSIVTVSLFSGPLFSMDKQKGGVLPCLVSLFLDPRLGYQMNEKAINVDLMHLLKFVPVIGQFVVLYNGYTGYMKSKSFDGCCIGFFGYTTANMMDTTKGRTVEWLFYLPIANLYSLFVVISETMGGKTWSQVVTQENLRRK